uniref:Uncharacterized protein n=1 Tax=Myoviridae sp. ctuJM17 TaxID=2825200 RepID=A0A8S5PJU8_9CAUD|nr:MAG TPA: hypothetical protein [Myoviridae sp. ctuJM17]
MSPPLYLARNKDKILIISDNKKHSPKKGVVLTQCQFKHFCPETREQGI